MLSLSHPAGVRGLKHADLSQYSVNKMSHPAGVRGLKHINRLLFRRFALVAPRRGAWIETDQFLDQ